MRSTQFAHTHTLTYTHIQLSDSSKRPLKVTQFHFTAWPDHGVPEYATPILTFHRRVTSQHIPSRGPLLVHCRLAGLHLEVGGVLLYSGWGSARVGRTTDVFMALFPPCCSAGIGRTGTFITIDCVLEQLQREHVIDIFSTINRIRQQRMKLVQTVVCWYTSSCGCCCMHANSCSISLPLTPPSSPSPPLPSPLPS